MSNVRLWTVATGRIDPFRYNSMIAVKFITGREGFMAVHSDRRGMLWLFDTENHAKIARNEMRAEGIQCGNNICTVFVDEKELERGKLR